MLIEYCYNNKISPRYLNLNWMICRNLCWFFSFFRRNKIKSIKNSTKIPGRQTTDEGNEGMRSPEFLLNTNNTICLVLFLAGDSHQHGGHQIEGAQEFFNSFETFYKDSSQICDDETSRSSISGSTARSTATADRGIETSPQHRLSYPREFKLLVIEQYYSNGQNKYRTCKDFQITK